MGWKELGGEVITYGVEEGEEVGVEAWTLELGTWETWSRGDGGEEFGVEN